MRRYLVVANQTLGGAKLRERVRALAQEEETHFHVVVPATEPKDQGVFQEAGAGGAGEPIDQTGRELARKRLRKALGWFADDDLEADGEIGDPDPMEAINDALAGQRIDGIVLSTLPRGISRWVGLDLPSRVKRKVDVPVEHIEGRDRS